MQLAGLCQRFSLANSLVEQGGNPLAGVQKMNFLGFLIRYQAYSAHELSNWFDYVVDDPVPNVLRRFPHPTTVRKATTIFSQMTTNGDWKGPYFRGL